MKQILFQSKCILSREVRCNDGDQATEIEQFKNPIIKKKRKINPEKDVTPNMWKGE